jgi:hypothetical protein
LVYDPGARPLLHGPRFAILSGMNDFNRTPQNPTQSTSATQSGSAEALAKQPPPETYPAGGKAEEKDDEFEVGETVTDKLTGFRGRIVTKGYGLVSGTPSGDKLPEVIWLEASRIEGQAKPADSLSQTPGRKTAKGESVLPKKQN